MNERRLPGIRFEAIMMSVAPAAAKHKGQTIPAIRFAVTDRQAYRPVRTSLLLIEEIRRRHPRDFAWTGTINRLTGSDKVRLAIEAGRLSQLLEEWDRGGRRVPREPQTIPALPLSRQRGSSLSGTCQVGGLCSVIILGRVESIVREDQVVSRAAFDNGMYQTANMHLSYSSKGAVGDAGR